jgi:hypothetical protein
MLACPGLGGQDCPDPGGQDRPHRGGRDCPDPGGQDCPGRRVLAAPVVHWVRDRPVQAVPKLLVPSSGPLLLVSSRVPVVWMGHRRMPTLSSRELRALARP